MATSRRIDKPAPPSPTGVGGRGGNAGRAGVGSSTFWDSLQAAWGIPDLRRRIIFVFAMFGVYTVGLHVPIANIDHAALDALFKSGGGSGLLAMIDMFSGGALKQFSVFGLGIIPYINSSIIMQLMTFAIPELQERSREGETGRRYIAQITRYLTGFLGLVQACGLCFMLHSNGVLPAINFASLVGVYLPTVLSLVAGTMFLMWIGEMITERGIGNGVSLIIFCGIMVRLPSQIVSVGQQVAGGSVNPLQALVLIAAFLFTVVGIIYVTLGQRRVPIQHVRRIVGNKMSQGGTSYLPFRVNAAGVIPIIFAVSITLLMPTLAQYMPPTTTFMHLAVGQWVHSAAQWMRPGVNSLGGWIASFFYAAIIMFFTYFWTAVMMDIPHMAQELKKYGSFIPGIRPGKPTEEYLDRVMTRITFGGAVFLALVALLNYWVPAITNTGSSFTLVGGTSLLIVVGVALDTMQAIEAQLLMRHYEGFIR